MTYRAAIAFLLIGLVAGIGASLAFSHSVTTANTTTYTSNITTTVVKVTISTMESTSTIFTSNNGSSNSGVSVSQIELALNYSSKSKLNMTSYAFESSGPQKEELIASFENSGIRPLIVSPEDCLLNGTFYYQNTSLGGGPRFGNFIYVAPKAFFEMEIVGLHALPGDNSTLQIYGNFWSLKYGTSGFFS